MGRSSVEDDDLRGEYGTHAGYMREIPRRNYPVTEGNFLRPREQVDGPFPVHVPLNTSMQRERTVLNNTHN